MKYLILIFFLIQHFNLHGQDSTQNKYISINTSNSLLPTNKITTIYFDRDENIWLGTYDQGLIRIGKDGIKVFNKNNSAIASNYIYRIKEDKKNSLWVSTMGGGMVEVSNDSLIIFKDDNSDIGHNWIYDFDFDEDNNLWISTWGNGLVKFDGQKFEKMNDERKTIPYKVCDVLVEDSIIWIGSVYGLISLKDGEYYHYTPENSELIMAPIYKLLKTNNGNLWLGYKQSGLAKFENGLWNYLEESSNISVYEMAEDRYGCLWIANFNKGLVKFDGTEFTYFTKANSQFPDDLIYSVTIDENDNKWIGSYFNGIIIFNENGLQLKDGKLKLIFK